jgi:dienelactone hydrolase
MLHRTRRDWEPLASALASQGIGALAFDLRGHGDSQATMPEEGQFAAFVQDVTAARRYVAARPDVQPARIGLAGATLGANLVVLSAAEMPGAASLALLSASTDYRGLRIDAAFRKYAGRALLVSSDEDPYATRSVRDLIKAAGGPRGVRETLALSNAGNGTAMLTRDPTLIRALVDWFKRTLQ